MSRSNPLNMAVRPIVAVLFYFACLFAAGITAANAQDRCGDQEAMTALYEEFRENAIDRSSEARMNAARRNAREFLSKYAHWELARDQTEYLNVRLKPSRIEQAKEEYKKLTDEIMSCLSRQNCQVPHVTKGCS